MGRERYVEHRKGFFIVQEVAPTMAWIGRNIQGQILICFTVLCTVLGVVLDLLP
jgi:hypothetical protein